MTKIFWSLIWLLAIVLGLLGFCVVTILALVGLVLSEISDALGNLFDWYYIEFLRTLSRVGKKLGV